MTKFRSIWTGHKELLPITRELFGLTLTVSPKTMANGFTKTPTEVNTKSILTQSQSRTKTTINGEFKDNMINTYLFKGMP